MDDEESDVTDVQLEASDSARKCENNS